MMGLKPLSGIRVLDFTAMLSGGFCTVILMKLPYFTAAAVDRRP
jgi:crotonobetainyl-CoA:carnitine CoA-transferase CaiB-like acyl-CoA transferase